MFSPQIALRPGRPNPLVQSYSQVGHHTAVDAATPHRLIQMLFEGLLDALAQAKGAIRAGQVQAKVRALRRATRIVDEGLRAALDLRGGGELSEDLHALYGYICMRLTMANLHNDLALLDECQRLVTPLHDAWRDIGPTVNLGWR